MATEITVAQLEEITLSNAWVDSDELLVTVGMLREFVEKETHNDGAYDEGYEDGIREAVNRIEYGG